jgi:hypothetical protein
MTLLEMSVDLIVVFRRSNSTSYCYDNYEDNVDYFVEMA